MKVSVDGASEDTYQIYRKGGSFQEVINNIKKINHYKKIYKSKLPKLKWQFIIFGHNEHELPLAKTNGSRAGHDLQSQTKLQTQRISSSKS